MHPGRIPEIFSHLSLRQQRHDLRSFPGRLLPPLHEVCLASDRSLSEGKRLPETGFEDRHLFGVPMHSHRVLTLPFALRLGLVALATGVLPAFAAAPGNDTFAGATVISEIPFSDSLDTFEATKADTDPHSLCDIWGGEDVGSGYSVWYAWTPTVSQAVWVSTLGSNYDTVASVWTGTEGALTELTCNDQYGGSQSVASFSATAGVTYYIMITAWDSMPAGDLEMALDDELPPLPPAFDISGTLGAAGVGVRTGEGRVMGTVTCSEEGTYSVSGILTQRTGRFLTTAYFYGGGTCSAGETDWVASVSSYDGSLVGRANYDLWIYGISTSGMWDSASYSGRVTVHGSSGH
jgi:hypothetical protein